MAALRLASLESLTRATEMAAEGHRITAAVCEPEGRAREGVSEGAPPKTPGAASAEGAARLTWPW